MKECIYMYKKSNSKRYLILEASKYVFAEKDILPLQ